MTATTHDPDALAPVYQGNSVEVRSLAMHLEDAGIESRVLGDFLDGAYAGINIGGMTERELWVAAKDRPAAQAIIAQWVKDYRVDDAPARGHRYQFSWRQGALVALLLFLLMIGFG